MMEAMFIEHIQIQGIKVHTFPGFFISVSQQFYEMGKINDPHSMDGTLRPRVVQ
jgi:hypothetical protein